MRSIGAVLAAVLVALVVGGAATTPEVLAQTVSGQEEPARPFLADHRIVSLYGTPLAPGLGSLGQQPPEQTVARARAQAEAYVPLSPDRTVVPALHLIYGVAQAAPGGDGLYLGRLSDQVVQQYIDLTRESGLLLFLDIQIGRSTIDREVAGVAGYLAHSHVHLALDPEFAWGPGVTPVEDIGYLTAAQIDQAQLMLAGIAADAGVPAKILIVHQFRAGMIRDKAAISTVDGVELVIDMDGFGPPASKLATYDAVITRAENLRFAGFKLFYEHDRPLVTPEDVMALAPQPVVVIYQ